MCEQKSFLVRNGRGSTHEFHLQVPVTDREIAAAVAILCVELLKMVHYTRSMCFQRTHYDSISELCMSTAVELKRTSVFSHNRRLCDSTQVVRGSTQQKRVTTHNACLCVHGSSSGRPQPPHV